MNNLKQIGLIAGASRLPVIVAQGAKDAGFKIVCLGIEDNVEDQLRDIVDVYYKVPLVRFGTWIRKLKKHNITETIMVGKVEKSTQFMPFRIIRLLPDWRGLRIWYWRTRKTDKRPDTLLNALADELATGGIILEDSTMCNKKDLADKGIMTSRSPDKAVTEDIEFGVKIAKMIGQADIGQAVAVREKETIAVEAIEGTAKMIERAGRLVKKNWTLVKVAKPQQDMRFDVPCIGPETIESVKNNGGVCIAIEAEKTFIVDKEQTIELADKHKISLVGV